MITVGCWGGEEVLCAQVSPQCNRGLSWRRKTLSAHFSMKPCAAEMMMLQSVFLISPGVFGHSGSPQSLSPFVKSETPNVLEHVNRFVSQIRKKKEINKNRSEAENGVLLPAACVEVSRLTLPVLMERRRGVLPRGEIGVGGGERGRGGHWRSHLCN